MQEKTKNMIITIGFITILFSVFIINLFMEDKQISTSERRKLTQFPEVTMQKIANGEVTKNLEKYAVDQFVARDFFRGIKSFYSINIFRQKDNNNLFEKDGKIYKIEYPLKVKNIEMSANKINEICDNYLQGMNIYYAIIPDKNYYLQNDEHLTMDYEELKEIMENKLDIKYIDIWQDLSLNDYYNTDIHWRQEKLESVVNTIKRNMNLKDVGTDYEVKSVGDFYGTYYGQLGIQVPPDEMYILTNHIIDNCTTYNYETKKKSKIYEKSNSTDKYDIYLSGATPIISIENPEAKNKKELLLFRDSFGSSIAPLFVDNYSKITLIDIRYISSKILSEYINFNNQDVLFLYSSLVLNQNILK